MVAITDKYRRLVEKRMVHRRSLLLPMRVSRRGETLFEGATLDVSDRGVYFRMPGGEDLSVGMRVRLELNIPSTMTGNRFGVRRLMGATVVRVEDTTLAHRVGCHPRDCGVALALDPEVPAGAAARTLPQTVAVA
jgi:hypothetical protein